ncbi:MAG: MBL fold metallo-hydrolase [Opitutales bacterium]|nr:MBL fold metallo-hydrolase [Opitutales bacterium]
MQALFTTFNPSVTEEVANSEAALTFPIHPMKIPLEDDYEDILQKALSGWQLDVETLHSRSGLSRAAVTNALDGCVEEVTARALAPLLQLDADALLAIGKRSWEPARERFTGLKQISTAFRNMRVNAWILHDANSGDAAIFDTGTDEKLLLDYLRGNKLTPRGLFLTHAHADHILALPALRRELPHLSVYAPSGEPVSSAIPLSAGHCIRAGTLTVEVRSTPGHSPDGLTYLVPLGDRNIAFVGDALFAGSMGGAANAWQEALTAVRRQILSLPGDTVLCPGHGPATTVKEERRHNPFHALHFKD